MHPATASTRHAGHARSNRRLVGGLAISVLLHVLLLSLQFGVAGGDAGGRGPLNVVLAPAAEPGPAPLPLPAPVPDPAPTVAASPTSTAPTPVQTPPVAAVPPALVPARGLRLVDLPPPPPLAVAQIAPAPKARPRRPTPVAPKRVLRDVATPVIAMEANPESAFAVAVPLPEVDAGPPPTVVEPVDAPEEVAVSEIPVPPEPVVDVEAERAAQEALARRAADAAREQALQQELALQREQEQAQQAQAQAEAQRNAAEASRLAEQQQQQQQAQQQAMRDQEALLARERQAAAARDLAAQRAAQEAATQEALVQAQLQARQQAAERQRNEELAQRKLADEQARQQAAERQRVEELAQRRLAEERAGQQAAEQARLEAERLARGAAEEAARRAAAQRLQAQTSGAAAGPTAGATAGPAAGGGAAAARVDGGGVGVGSGAGTQPGPGVMAGLPGNRARELLRGVTIPNVDASGLPRDRPAGNRRVVADGGERDAPLRLYVDSVRQKLERNAVLGGARLSLRDVRIDPLVSVSLRSDGSIDEITIVRSSGRADMDDAVRRFVRLNARYAAFPPNVAANFDVIEIRRIWRFAEGLKLVEEMR